MILRGVAIVIPAQIIKLFVSLALQILIARILLPEGRGLYGVCLAISLALVILSYFGNEFGIRHLLVLKRITSAQALRYLLITASLSWAAAVTLAFFAIKSDVWLPDGVTWPLLFLACSLSFCQLITTQINVYMTLRGQFGSAAILAVAEELFKLILAVVLLVRLRTVEAALLASIIGSSLIAGVSVLFGGFLKKDFKALRLEDFQTIYGYGVRSLWLNLSNLSNAHLGTLVLSGLMSNAQIGIYNLAFGLVARLQVVPDALNRVLVPASVARNSEEERLRIIQVSVAGLTLFCLSAAPLLAAFNKPIFQVMFGTEYIAAGPIAFFLFIGFSCKVIGKPLEAYFLEISGKPAALGAIQLFAMLMVGILTYLGAEWYGLIGAAVGSSLALIVSSAALLALYARSTERRIISLFDFRTLILRMRKP
ncbi:oligosaccharide flippase family protein [Erythrobacter sp.]|uniref:lipopolysaccharide biosynthesis protein n=1 Tax=Erythrobacter sp. TaxID=1042 RepID=UPI001B0D22C3|nr:oligosaccharide flippase family protein [Erythrobacter sp.]MBO6526351.1 oligosaccharide flippase family protein [Erythrobacter sp.]MBO6530604.1 oligosaccharide flippase family protein [Erythrobacter sp.]